MVTRVKSLLTASFTNAGQGITFNMVEPRKMMRLEENQYAEAFLKAIFLSIDNLI